MLSVAADHCVSCLNSCPFIVTWIQVAKAKIFHVNTISHVFHISGLTNIVNILPEISSHSFTHTHLHTHTFCKKHVFYTSVKHIYIYFLFLKRSVLCFLDEQCFYLVLYSNFEIPAICILLSFWAPVF